MLNRNRRANAFVYLRGTSRKISQIPGSNQASNRRGRHVKAGWSQRAFIFRYYITEKTRHHPLTWRSLTAPPKPNNNNGPHSKVIRKRVSHHAMRLAPVDIERRPSPELGGALLATEVRLRKHNYDLEDTLANDNAAS